MKHILALILVIWVSLPTIANDGKEAFNEFNKTVLYNSFSDPGHSQKRGKDKSPIELYLGVKPGSFGVKLNSYMGANGNLTESFYLMTTMDFNDEDPENGDGIEPDLHAKIGINLNGKKKYNQNKVNPLIRVKFFQRWRYIQWRHSIEIGYKTYFLDPEETTSEKLVSTNYGGLTVGYSWIGDALDFLGIKLLKPSWYTLDMRTARKIRTKIDVGVFVNLDEFDPSHIGFATLVGAQGESNGTAFNENIRDDFGSEDFESPDYNSNFGQPLEMPIYPLFSLFFNISIGIALW